MAKFYDTLIWEYINNPWTRGLSLDKLAERNFAYKMISYSEITDKDKINFKDINLVSASKYSGEDVYITNRIYKLQEEKWLIHNEVLQNIELPLLEVLVYMEMAWVKIDRNKLKWIWILFQNEIKNLEKKIYSLSLKQFNIQSPKQVWELLFEELWLPRWKKTKTWWSVSSEVLWDLAHNNPIVQLIIDYRKYSKLLSTYVEWLILLLDKDDFLHTSYNQAVTTTWRLSSTKPNLQNIPISDSISWEIRNTFISRFPKWWKIMSFDYSQIEVRLLAILSWDENLLSAFENNFDIHTKTAESIFWKKDILPSERKVSKAVNFWIIYGISSFWLSKQLGISMKDAKNYIDNFYSNYPKTKIFFDDIINFCEKNTYVQTIFWRKRYIWSINDKNNIIKKSAEREAINMPIQWTSADIIKIAMIEINKFLNTPLQICPITNLKIKWWYKLQSKMIMQVHDELVFDVLLWEENILEKEIKDIMQWVLYKNLRKLKIGKLIDLKVDVWIGETWGNTKN